MTNYNPETEKKWMKYWEKEKIYKFDKKSKLKAFTIDTPPPTVSGAMHIGHAFSYAQQDYIARYFRMRGFNVFYPFGTDDNGLPTERLVEKMKKVRGVEMPRDKFVKLCYETVKEIKDNFVKPWKELGMSCDFEETYSTIDEHAQKTSQASFLELYHKGFVYQKDAPTIWCVECQTAIAQAELKDVELESTFNDIVFKVGNEDLIISTTRPELIPACVAVLINPKDKRAKNLKEKFAKVPLFDYEVPVLGDDKVSMEKGSGIVMCCTFGDITDIEWWNKFKLPLRIVFNRDGKLNNLAKGYEALKIKEARKKILEDLEKNNLLKAKRPIKHVVNTHERCHTEIEFLKTKQWFVRVLDKKQELLEAGKKIKWKPKYMVKRYEHWIENLQWDWCISRQRFFGVPFPVWHCKKCNEIILADINDLPIDPLTKKPKKKCHCGSNEFIPEKDVMDTWATSSVTPQIALNWIEKDKMFENFPMDLRPQAHDIITTWAFYTIIKGIYMHEKIPWKNIAISGHVLNPFGKKMSKSKGDVVEPLEVIEKYGADSLRFWAAESKLGDDLAYREADIEKGKKTVTKLWNASKFVLTHLEKYKNEKPKNLEVIDKWLLSKLSRTIKNSTESFEGYEYSKAKAETEYFFWRTFCDNYLEITKDRLYNDKRGKEEKISAQYTLSKALNSILKLFAPIMPFVTEEIYQNSFAKKEKCKSIHISEWPNGEKENYKEEEKTGDDFAEILSEVRKYKAANKLSLKTPVKITIPEDKEKSLKDVLKDLKAVCVAEEINFGNKLIIKE